MAIVTNNSKTTPIGLPGGIVIPPGGAADVPGWDEVAGRQVVAHYVKAGVLAVADALPDAPAGADSSPPPRAPAAKPATSRRSGG